MNIISFPQRSEWKNLLARPVKEMAEIEQKVLPILQKVKHEGDSALKEFALKFDKVELNNFQVSQQEIDAAEGLLSFELKEAIGQAYNNIYTFHQSQKQSPEVIETMAGVKCWRKSVGIQKVGFYIPGGTAPLFSTVLMLGVPAQIAGCEERILCSPSNHPAIYYAAKLVGITKVYRIGGAQAIAAMAYGTESIPQVYKIFGPGNQYVTAAKQLLSKEGVAIDMPAGPSEVAVMADDFAIPSFVASDLLSQAEHGADSQVLLVSTSKKFVSAVNLAVSGQLNRLPRKDLASKAIENSKIILLDNEQDCIDLINEYAPEHLILAVENYNEVGEKIINAGSIFLGNYTPESCGDYASGTNHTLPTNGYARAYSGVSVDSFVKKITFQEISKEGILNIGRTVELMAEAESLEAHKRAVSLRMESLTN
ncbi:Histidinol dehydrogenase [Emticicia oligotrophica DSM 17448]|uniref:Histidinol dehydrogenase n=1 Tax=Emticicia oligotrophica (strain DSM 17448 / CIP 109782 / MTCC 6937 / GPTSA100-15) TaxID=929562 RepID=A0ABN4AR87_EMTOG|nr:histidinol dehydrogenase [Emticicia oligotrophica]AFK05014.1 Histidinol dehydrogenase [Emticicia oligotrophica DSM 17448]